MIKKAFRTAMLTVLLGAAAFAQGPFGPRATGGTPPDPATRIAHQVSRLTTLLDLTTSQAGQVTSILTAEQSSLSALQSTASTDHTTLQTAIKANNTAGIDQAAAAIGTLNGQVLAVRSKAEAAIYAILTSAQQAKLDTIGGLGLLGGPGGPGGPRGPGGPGGPRGPRP